MPTTHEKLSIPENATAVTPNDSTDLTTPGVIYVGGSGDIAVTTAGGDDVTFSSVGAGTFLPVQVSRVKSTATTATNILVLY